MSKSGKAVLLGDGNGKVSFTNMRDVGVLVVAALHTLSDVAPRTLEVNSFTTTPREMLVGFERQPGKRWSAKHMLVEELGRLGEETWAKGDGTRYTLRNIWTEGWTF
jgi:hypothetical protein